MTERMYRVRCHGQMLYHGDNLDVAMSVYNRTRTEHNGQHQPTLDEAEWHEIKRAEGGPQIGPAGQGPPGDP